MAELFFIATVIFVAYVVYVVLGDKKDKPELSNTEKTSNSVKPVVNIPEQKEISSIETSKKEEMVEIELPVQNSIDDKTPDDSVKNPKTGEIAKVSTNYPFAKRWIKEALVEEGLLDKIYKNTELNEEVNEKIQLALQALKGMDKYR